MDTRTSKTIYIAKAFAVLSIICAHCGGVNAGSSYLNVVSAYILSSLGSLGVGIFLFLSGYLLFFTKKGAYQFFKSKLVSLLLPWMFCGTVVYLYVYLRKGGLGVLSLLKWLAGVDTYLYFMTVLTALYVICYFFKKNKTVLLVLTAISFVWNIVYDILIKVDSDTFRVIYLDPIRFMLFFTVGLLVANYGFMSSFLDFCKKYAVAVSIIFVTIIVALACCKMEMSYFSVYYIFVELLAIAQVLGISAACADKMSAHLTCIGKASFSIYLLHMPIAGIVANLFKRANVFVLTLARPFIVLAVVCFAIWVANKIIPKGKILNVFNTLIGMR